MAIGWDRDNTHSAPLEVKQVTRVAARTAPAQRTRAAGHAAVGWTRAPTRGPSEGAARTAAVPPGSSLGRANREPFPGRAPASSARPWSASVPRTLQRARGGFAVYVRLRGANLRFSLESLPVPRIGDKLGPSQSGGGFASDVPAPEFGTTTVWSGEESGTSPDWNGTESRMGRDRGVARRGRGRRRNEPSSFRDVLGR